MSKKSKRTRRRRVRRQQRAAQRHGRTAKPRHTLRSGRTGNVHAKRTPSKKPAVRVFTIARTIEQSVCCSKCGARPGELHQHA